MNDTLPTAKSGKLPRAFVLRRLHSLMGLWLTIYLFEHLLVNSQAALFFENRGAGFVSLVNKIHDLPYLSIIEIVFLGIPFLVHGWWGILYLRNAKYNSFPTDGSTPALPMYKENRAYTWQRWTGVLLAIGIIAHVVHMRFVSGPDLIYQNNEKAYFNKLSKDLQFEEIANKVHATFYTQNMIEAKKIEFQKNLVELAREPENFELKDQIEEQEIWLKAATKKSLKGNQVLVESPNAGTAFILVLRESFKNPITVGIYSIFVLIASYHAFNGLWTFMITWGVTLTKYSQKIMRRLAGGLMIIVSFLGLMAAIGTYLSLKY